MTTIGDENIKFKELEERYRAARQEAANLRSELRRQKKQIAEIESDLARSRDIFQVIVETTDNGIMIEDEEGFVVFANTGLVELLRCASKKDVLDRPWSDFFDVEYEKKIEGKVGVYESMLVPTSGDMIPVLVSTSSFYFQGDYIGILSVIKDISEQKRTEQILRDNEKKMRALSHRVITAQEEERAWLARELHDDLGQQLAAMQLVVVWLKSLKEMNRTHVEPLSEKIGNMTRELKRICRGLRPSTLDSLGLAAAVEIMAKDVEVTGDIDVELNLTGKCEKESLVPEVSINVYRIIQEALTNVLKHSCATNVSVSMHCCERVLEIHVTDDGSGMDMNEESKGFGITGIKERVALCGGTVEFDSAPGAGTGIHVKIPVQIGEGTLKE